mgnify:CR=1 FL=1
MKPAAIVPAAFPWFDYSGFTFSLGVDLGDLVFNSGHTGASYDPSVGKMAIGGPMSGQVTVAYEKAEAILGGVGLGFDDVVLVTEYVTVDGLEFYDDVRAAREQFLGGVRPAVSTVVVDRLVRRNAYVEIEITASRTRDVPGQGDPARSASREAADGTVYLSTIHPYDENGALVGGDDVAAQVEQIFINARRQLQALGLDTSDIVKTLEMVRPEALPTYKGTGRVRKAYLLEGPVVGFPWWLMWLPVCVAIGFDAVVHPNSLWVSLAIGIPGMVISIWLHRKFVNANDAFDSKWQKNLVGESLSNAYQTLEEIERARID